jgi:hypothetical protein
MLSGVKTLLVCLALLGYGLKPAAPQTSAPQKSPALPFAIGDARAVVLYFIASDCPISNRTLPEMLRIEHQFASRSIRFYFVYPNSSETPATIRAHRAAYGIEHNTLTDPHEALAKLTGANVTPEAAILIPSGTTLKSVYTGRIDDRYLSLGTERPAATRHDLEDAIAAVLSNHPVPPPGGPPVGCAFMTLPAK